MKEITADGWDSWKHHTETKYAVTKIKQEQTKLLQILAQHHILDSTARFQVLGMYEALGFVLDLLTDHKVEGVEPTGDKSNESVYRDFDKFIHRFAAAGVPSTGKT